MPILVDIKVLHAVNFTCYSCRVVATAFVVEITS